MNISIIGCGWLGKDLARVLEKEHTVLCYNRHENPKDKDLNWVYSPPEDHTFWKCDLLILALSTRDHYLESIREFLTHVHQDAKLILLSSTSVYKGNESQVDERTPLLEKTLQVQAEQLIQTHTDNHLILRLGGLMGNDRIAGQWANSTRSYPDGPVNYVHKDDLLQLIPMAFSLSGVYNIVAPQHPLRSEVHAVNAQRFCFAQKQFDGFSQRNVSAQKIVTALNYTFIHPDPLHFWDAL